MLHHQRHGTAGTKEVAEIYRRRWDIEVFFRFLKQELSFSHFLSVNENSMQVILYMTLITYHACHDIQA